MKLTEQQIIDAFNKWLEDYTNDPKKFEAEHKIIIRHMEERFAGSEITYGKLCLATLEHYAK